MTHEMKTPAGGPGLIGMQLNGSALPLHDNADATRFLRILDPTATSWTFQTFDDNEDRKLPALARKLHGSLGQYAAELEELNRRGAGVFVTVNETDGKGRKVENILRVRAVFADFDGTPLPDHLPLPPHLVVESSPGRWHTYWRVDGVPLEQFRAVQLALAEQFGSDPRVADVSRVMRLPGFLHQKGTPRLVQLRKAGTTPPYPPSAFLPLRGAQTSHAQSVQGRPVEPETVTRLRSALHHLHADDRDLWIAMGHALYELGDVGRGLWLDWSWTSKKWKPTDAQLWDGFKGDRTGYQAVFARAQAAGWVNPESSAARVKSAESSSDGRIEIVPASAIPPEPIEWLWHGWLARGKLTVLAGAPGTGKTTLALEWAASLSAGRLMHGTLGNICPRPQRVLIWSGEDDAADTLIPRLIAAGANLDYIGIIQGFSGKDGHRTFDPARDMETLTRSVKGQGGELAMILLDPLANAVAGDSHKNTEVRRSLQPAVDFAQSMNAALLGITHFTKGTQGRDPLDRVTGSLAFGALPRVVIGAGKAAGTDDISGQMVFARVKANNAAPGGGYLYHIEQVTVADNIVTNRIVYDQAVDGSARDLLGEPEPGNGSDDNRDAAEFLRELLQDGAVPSKQVFSDANGAGYSRHQLKRAKAQLGVVAKKHGLDHWTWQLPDASE